MEPMFEALRKIHDARDYCAEHGKYPEGTVGDGQSFDDWAADLAEVAMAQEMTERDTQADALNLKRRHRMNIFANRG